MMIDTSGYKKQQYSKYKSNIAKCSQVNVNSLLAVSLHIIDFVESL